MESRVRRIFLTVRSSWVVNFAYLLVLSALSAGAMSAEGDGRGQYSLEPEIERTDLKEADINAFDFEIGAFAGLLSVEDFGVNTLIGGFLAYHVTEDFFFVAHYGQADTELSSFELLSGAVPILNDEERELSYYDFNIAYRVLPGEAFVGRSIAFNQSLYFLLGAGNTDFAGDTRFTINVGAGYQFLLWDYLSLKLDIRDHIFDHDLFAEEKTSHNLEFTLGVSLYL